MKILIISLAILATALASLPSEEYLPPLEDASSHNNVDLQTLSESSPLADDGYRYKTVKRFRLRHRRDVSELPNTQYLPPVPSTQYIPPVGAASEAQPIADLPVIHASASQDSAVLADDGYHYKTVKRYRLRHRRDVSELPAAEYLPPVEESASAHVAVEAVPAASDESAVLADDGYRYKAVKRYRLRHRRDVSELPAAEYLPPVEESASAHVAVEAVPAASEESAALADDGYRYKTVKRYRLRHRRDVNELPANEYLPPVEESASAHVAFEAVPAASDESAVLADDGYRYKAVKRYRLRHRRDVSELPAAEYLPPVEESASVHVAVEAVPAASEESAALADDGYRYKTVKRYRLRHRRDVNELPANEYLPPVESAAASAVVEVEAVPAPSQESAVFADDGYRYKTVKRVVYRHRA